MSNNDNLQTIEKLINNYYNNNLLQKGGNNKLDKNIVRLYNCYVLSQNQNQDKLSLQIKTRLDNKIIKLADELIGGEEVGEVKEKGKAIKGYLWGEYESDSIEKATKESDSIEKVTKESDSIEKTTKESDSIEKTASNSDLIEKATKESDLLGNYIKKILIDYINKLKLNTTQITINSASSLANIAKNSTVNLVKKVFTNKTE